MRRIAATPLLAFCLLLLACALARAQNSLVSNQASSKQPAPYHEPFPGITPVPMKGIPLSRQPYVYALKRLDPSQMSPNDTALINSLHLELQKKASLASFNLDSPGWRYQQIVCPAFPDFVILAFRHGPDPDGSSRFVAALGRDTSRDTSQVSIVSTAAHGLLSFGSAWSKSATYQIFNRMLRQERGFIPLGNAPNWLVISMCYAELSGNHVQVLTTQPLPGPTLDLLRLNARLPEVLIDPDRSALVTFSDASKPETTTSWTLNFDPRGQITSAGQARQRQPRKIALKP